MPPVEACLDAFCRGARDLGWIRDAWLAGSLASGDHRPGVSDIDLLAVTEGPMTAERVASIVAMHEDLDAGAGAGLDLGCVYVDSSRLAQVAVTHPTWTHGRLVRRILSGITRAELLQFGRELLGRPAAAVLAPMGPADVRDAARQELAGYWAWAVRRPWMWRSPVIADLGLTSMARGRYALEHGSLISKGQALDLVAAPPDLAAEVRARRVGAPVSSSSSLRLGWVAWRDAFVTTRTV